MQFQLKHITSKFGDPIQKGGDSVWRRYRPDKFFPAMFT